MTIPTSKVQEIQKNLEADVAEIKKIEAGNLNLKYNNYLEFVKVEQAK